jgi:hypothetical protein
VDRNGHYSCDPDTTTQTIDPDGTIHLTVTKGACHSDPTDLFKWVPAEQALDWFNTHVNLVYHVMSIPVKFEIHTKRLEDDQTLYNASINAMLAMISNPGQMDEQQFMQSAVSAINAEKDYQNTAVFGIGADLTEVTGLIESHFPGTGTAVENAIKSGMDISEDSLSKTIQTAQGIHTE